MFDVRSLDLRGPVARRAVRLGRLIGEEAPDPSGRLDEALEATELAVRAGPAALEVALVEMGECLCRTAAATIGAANVDDPALYVRNVAGALSLVAGAVDKARAHAAHLERKAAKKAARPGGRPRRLLRAGLAAREHESSPFLARR